MGYTHYWYREFEIDSKIYKLIKVDMEKVCKKVKSEGIQLAGWDGTGKPEFSSNINFNGTDDESHESFSFPKIIEPFGSENFIESNLQFNFCKTACKPYDLAVTACLIVAKHHLKDKIKVSSDGIDEDWNNGKKLCQDLFGYGLEYNISSESGLQLIKMSN